MTTHKPLAEEVAELKGLMEKLPAGPMIAIDHSVDGWCVGTDERLPWWVARALSDCDKATPEQIASAIALALNLAPRLIEAFEQGEQDRRDAAIGRMVQEMMGRFDAVIIHDYDIAHVIQAIGGQQS